MSEPLDLAALETANVSLKAAVWHPNDPIPAYAMRQARPQPDGSLFTPVPFDAAWQACAVVDQLIAEVKRLRAQVAGHCDRIAAQSELLTRKAGGEGAKEWP